ncbi:2-hydroxyacid dehydrogenase [Marinitenerispora sediminis]|uniref:Hydroxyacid dehydrogenase n=1 Tax=Marinitenerispora sediminis TaxID=1931232 RepID=A0A368TB64_9ACTN|nr:2-hydroxyacid dehydrogenase [Marinitenerispora sediminis]RCV53676.1 hydroxyacid dehydrogenase [Marinitenerispora sediminis]RCV57340.1 hydroxyacid dehydrogenase [Marinitenerispora sediminis]RCV62379.1 hydroxyacid dehydrogenase [Marinitenerispora sediminis]
MKIVIADPNLLAVRPELERALPSGARASWHVPADPAAVTADLADAEVFVGSRFTAAMAGAAPRLRLVQVAGAGVDGVDTAALPAGVRVANTFHHEDSIAEYVVATAVTLRRGLARQDAALRTGRWASPVYDRSLPQPRALVGARVGFLGFGHIGARTWELLRAFRAAGAAVTRTGSVDAAACGLDWAGGLDDLDRLLAESELLVVSVPLGERTRGMISARELALLGPEAVLVNVGRGPVVDEQALYAALRDRRLAGAALDVWYRYPGPDGGADAVPPASAPFHELDTVVMTPHVSGVTRDTFLGRAADVAANIARLAAGQPLSNVVEAR